MLTERIYYGDAYAREFTARIIERTLVDGRPAVVLDRTALYPTGGGQPHDTGWLNEVEVVDVQSLDDRVLHLLGAELAGDEVRGVIDWRRRHDHMQQHTGQHVLSQAFVRLSGAETVGFHLGEVVSTIDVEGVHTKGSDWLPVEEAANQVIDDALPVRTRVYGASEIGQIPLRKPPTVTEEIRIVEVEGFDWSACGGTHVRNSAEIGLIKIVGTERRGGETRISFLCGARARRDYDHLLSVTQEIAARFSTSRDELPEAVGRLMSENASLRRELGQLEASWVDATARAMVAAGMPLQRVKLVSGVVEWPVERAKRVAQSVRAEPGVILLLGITGERPQLLFTRSDDIQLDVGALLREAAAAEGGRGGGRADWAQGGVPASAGLARAIAAAENSLNNSRY